VKVYIGHDEREADAYRVCEASMRSTALGALDIQPISRLTLGDLYARPTVRRDDGSLFDPISNAPMSTDFAIARFFIPLIQKEGWALFCDCDFLWRAPVEELMQLADERYPVMCVHHEPYPTAVLKMDGQFQVPYRRKNWSSLMLINCARWQDSGYAQRVNRTRGILLHQFTGYNVGALSLEWNWLVGLSPPVRRVRAAHFTLGVPSMPGYENVEFADEWRVYGNS
jgi:hypothetical protein